jgi:hypothetical protein
MTRLITYPSEIGHKPGLGPCTVESEVITNVGWAFKIISPLGYKLGYIHYKPMEVKLSKTWPYLIPHMYIFQKPTIILVKYGENICQKPGYFI